MRVVLLMSAAAYVALLLWSLRDAVSPLYTYMGFGYSPPRDGFVQLVTWVLAILPCIFMPLKGARPSAVGVWILYLLAYVPAQIVPVYASARRTDYVSFQLTLFLGLLLVIGLTSLPIVRIVRVWFDERLFFLFLSAFSLATYALVILKFGIPTSIPGIFDVYSVRSAFEVDAQGAGIVIYLMNWQSKVINPFLMAYGIVRKRPLFFLSGMGLQLLLYGLAANKSVLFAVVLVFGIIIACNIGRHYMGLVLIVGASALVAVSTILLVSMNNIVLVTLFVRRMIMVPGLLTGYYQEFFSSEGMTRNLDPVSRAIFKTPFQDTVPHIIGGVYFNEPTMSANANLWADGFAAFGYPGVIVVSVLAGLVFYVFDALSVGRELRIVSVLAGVSAFNLVNSGLATSLSTHGMLIAIVLLFLLPPNVKNTSQSAPATFRGKLIA